VVDAVLTVRLGNFDSKFQDAPEVALQLELTAAAGVTAIASTLVGIAAVALRRRLVFDRIALIIAALWGAGYPFLLRYGVAPVLGTLDPERFAVPALGIVCLVVFPLLFFLSLRRVQHARGVR
jgi:hypothetical protein